MTLRMQLRSVLEERCVLDKVATCFTNTLAACPTTALSKTIRATYVSSIKIAQLNLGIVIEDSRAFNFGVNVSTRRGGDKSVRRKQHAKTNLANDFTPRIIRKAANEENSGRCRGARIGVIPLIVSK